MVKILSCLLAATAAYGELLISETLEFSKVPSEFPVAFSLLTTPDRQYAAYYDANRRMTVAARALDSNTWMYHKLPTEIAWDSHNYVTMAMDSAGYLHVSGNMHCVPLIYFRTENPGDITTLRAASMTGELEDRVTYPRFFKDSEDNLVFTYRHGGSGNGINLYNRYDTATQTWSRLLDTPLFDGEGKRNAYPIGPTRGPDGWFHIHWVWRDTPDCATNQHLSYARSRDLMEWESAFGQKIELPIRFDQTELVIDPIPSGGGIINGGHRMAFDSKNNPVFVYHKSDTQGNMQIYAVREESGKWRQVVLTDWQHPVPFSGNGSMGFIGIRINDLEKPADNTFTVSYRHKVYGSGSLSFDERTFRVLDKPLATKSQLPRSLGKTESNFPGMTIRRAEDSGSCGTEGVRYLLQWETLDANQDKPRQKPLPAPSTLRLHKITESSKTQ